MRKKVRRAKKNSWNAFAGGGSPDSPHAGPHRGRIMQSGNRPKEKSLSGAPESPGAAYHKRLSRYLLSRSRPPVALAITVRACYLRRVPAPPPKRLLPLPEARRASGMTFVTASGELGLCLRWLSRRACVCPRAELMGVAERARPYLLWVPYAFRVLFPTPFRRPARSRSSLLPLAPPLNCRWCSAAADMVSPVHRHGRLLGHRKRHHDLLQDDALGA